MLYTLKILIHKLSVVFTLNKYKHTYIGVKFPEVITGLIFKRKVGSKRPMR